VNTNPSFRQAWEIFGAQVHTHPVRNVCWYDELRRIRFAFYPDTLQYTICITGSSRSWKVIERGKFLIKDIEPACFREVASIRAHREIARVLAKRFPATAILGASPIIGCRGRLRTVRR
jgi:hypothetical protein